MKTDGWRLGSCSGKGLTPVYVGTSKPANWSFTLPKWRGKRLQDVLRFTEGTATLLNAGVPIDRGLSIVGEMTERPEFRTIVAEILRSIRSGKSFAESLAEHDEYFSELYVSMIRAGEVSGSLALVMDRLAAFERARDELRGYIISSLMYPVLLILVRAARFSSFCVTSCRGSPRLLNRRRSRCRCRCRC